MARVFSNQLIVSVDIGTTKICVLIAQQLENSKLEILGVGKSPSDGLSKGVVVDIAKTIRSIKKAVKEAEVMAGIVVESAYIGISGAHIRSCNSQGAVPIKSGEIKAQDIANALAAARAIPVPEGQKILHVLPRYFLIDGHEKVQDPLGMHGVRLEVQVHIILGAVASVQNLVKCCESAGIKVNDIILEQLASSEAVLGPDERELGVGVLDIGGGTSDLALYQHGTIRHTMVLPVAGNHFSNDIAIGLRTTLRDAERIKKLYGRAQHDSAEFDETIEIELAQGNKKREISTAELTSIIEPRAQELLMLIRDELHRHQLLSIMPAGLVLTGGGSLLAGIKELAESILDVSVRVGRPQAEFELPQVLHSPIYATAYGLLVFAAKQRDQEHAHSADGSFSQRIMSRMKSWVSDFF